MSELVKKQFGRSRQALSKTLDGVSPEIFEIVPEGFNNNIHWQVGHILFVGEFFLFKGQETLPATYSEFFKPGSNPATWTGDVPSVETLLEQLSEQLKRINDIPNEAFNQIFPKPFLGNETAGELAAMGAYHEALHVGQIQALKRFIVASKVTK